MSLKTSNANSDVLLNGVKTIKLYDRESERHFEMAEVILMKTVGC